MTELQPTLLTEHFRIRPTVPADHDPLAAIASDSRVWDQHNHPERATPAGFRAFFDGGLQLGTALTFERRANGTIIGSCRYAALTTDGWEIGWTYFDPAVWGTGANAEIKAALLDHAFGHVPQVVFHVWQGNRRSQAAVRKLGATVISHLHPLAPANMDTLGFLLTRDAWRRETGVRKLRKYLTDHRDAQLVFVCTHNSRRSHLAAVLAHDLGHHAGYGLTVHSAGTEATACHPNTVAALRRAGYEVLISPESDSANPRYALTLPGADTDQVSHVLWSKTLADASLPSAGFAAVMVCSDADANCPFVPGAEARISLPFPDPKRSDGTGLEAEVYGATYTHIRATLARVFT